MFLQGFPGVKEIIEPERDGFPRRSPRRCFDEDRKEK
jgi:hypothetical protein